MLLLLFPVILMHSCGTNDRREVEEQIRLFETAYVPDKRETVFHAAPRFEQGNVVLLGETDNEELKNNLLTELKQWDVIDRIALLPDSTVGDTNFALVNLSVANLRAEPSHSSELVSQALLGTPVKILKKQKGWYLIQTPDKYISWVDAAGIQPIPRQALNRWKESERIIFTGYSEQIYENELLQRPMADVSMGGILEVKDERRYITQVIFPDGREGYIRPGNWVSFSEFIQTSQPDTTSVVNLARSLTGRPYLWGGTSVAAMDCSGFSKLIYYMHGTILARDASLQARHGLPADTNGQSINFMPGDLLFFGSENEEGSPQNITHVAISLGRSEYIHAAGKVEINSLDPESPLFSAYRKKTFVNALRIIGTEGTDGIIPIKDHDWY